MRHAVGANSESHDSFSAQSKPPEYDFDSIGVKMSLHYSTNDVFTGVDTAKKFGKRMEDHLIPNGMHLIDG